MSPRQTAIKNKDMFYEGIRNYANSLKEKLKN